MPTPEQNLDRSLVQGIAWTGGVKWATQIVSWAVTLVVARLLTPADYGLMGMATVYMGLARIVSEAGLAAAIIQARDLDAEGAAQLGGLAAALGIALCLVSVGLSGAVVWLFREPQVRGVVLVLSATFVTRGFQVLPRALLSRALRFDRVARIDGVESVVMAVGTLTFALLGLGYWALALGPLAGTLASLILCTVWRPHRLALPRAYAPIAHSVRFSGQVLVSQLAWYAYSNADFTVVGRFLGKVALGAYTLGWTMASVPVDRITSLVGNVVPPVFSAVQRDRRALGRYLCSLTEGVALVTLPGCVGLALVADSFVRVVLGPRWVPAIMPLRLLAIYAAFRSVVALTPQLMVYTGHAKRSMWYSVLTALVLPWVFYAGTRWGTTGVALGWVLAYPLLFGGLWVRDALAISGVSWATYLRALWPALRALAVMAAVVLALGAVLPGTASPQLRLLALAASGALAYAAVVLALDGRRVRALLPLLRGEARTPHHPTLRAPVHATRDVPGRDRLLLVTYHFPPDPAVGALRWQKLARHAAERGWGLDVIALHPRALRAAEPERLADLPPGVRVYGVSETPLAVERAVDAVWGALRPRRPAAAAAAPEPRPLARRLSLSPAELLRPPRPRDLARAYFAWLEYARGRRWAAEAAQVARALVVPGVHRAVISCGPPHFAHDAARDVAQQAGLPFVMDMRDPWSLVQRLPEAIASPVWYRAARRAERRDVADAALVVANTEPCAQAMRRVYPAAASRVIAVPNGCDDDPVPRRQRSTRFVMAYAGTVYLDRDPRPLFRAAARVARDLGLSPRELSLEFMGAVESYDGVPLERLAAVEGIADHVRLIPPGARRAALDFLSRAQLLVMLPQDSDLAIPGKLFEYMRFDAWLLALAERGSATELLLRGSEAEVVAPGDVDRIAAVIRQRYQEFARGLHGRSLAVHERFSRRAAARALFDRLESITGAPRRPEPESVLCAAS